jgi:mannose-6-phosphate isomerase
MLQPFKLEPTYRDYVWGGTRLRPGDSLTAGHDVTAEAWVVYEGNTILNGPYAGRTLSEAAGAEGAALLGGKSVAQTGVRFPLLIKLLDCAQWLSLQVHPNDEQAEQLEGQGHFGKTEAWYVVEADEGAKLLSGFRAGVTQNEIQKAVGTKAILDLVEHRDVKPGDTLFMSPGTIHALGPGLLIYEVQQTSDLTYRVYDWDRPMMGRRVLHIDQAIQTLNPDARGEVQPGNLDTRITRRENLLSCDYFSLDLIAGQSGFLAVDNGGKTFSALTVLEGQVVVQGEDWDLVLNKFETCLVPANANRYSIKLSKPVRALLAYVP